jgi:YD repeat-containing protein
MTQVEGLPSQNCASANQAYTYDANGFMASKTDWKGSVTTYTHNDRGLETSRTEASGTPQARTITTEWHVTLNLRTKITEPERETVFAYDTQGRLTSTEVTPR